MNQRNNGIFTYGAIALILMSWAMIFAIFAHGLSKIP